LRSREQKKKKGREKERSPLKERLASGQTLPEDEKSWGGGKNAKKKMG